MKIEKILKIIIYKYFVFGVMLLKLEKYQFIHELKIVDPEGFELSVNSLQGCCLPVRLWTRRAGNGDRTRQFQLGKLAPLPEDIPA